MENKVLTKKIWVQLFHNFYLCPYISYSDISLIKKGKIAVTQKKEAHFSLYFNILLIYVVTLSTQTTF